MGRSIGSPSKFDLERIGMADYKICPSCNHNNRVTANFCENCGKSFTAAYDPQSTTEEIIKPKLRENLEEKVEKADRPVPAEGIAIYVAGQLKPAGIRQDDEFIIGRRADPTEENIVDLTPYDAFSQGVSRQHLRVRHTGKGYMVMDLHSRNGTWVDDQFLAPQTPLLIKSNTVIRLGLLRIILAFQQEEKVGQQESIGHE